MEKQTLEQFIKSKLSALSFDELPEKMGISQTKFTRIMNRPQEADRQEATKLAAILKVDALFLINEFKMGHNNITLREMELMK